VSESAGRYDGLSAEALADRLGVPDVVLFSSVGSTMDEAHALASSGARAGTLVLADQQTAGRGRTGKRWSSPHRGLWLTLIERPHDAAAVEVLSLRIGLCAAQALDAFTAEPIRLKWPNDLYVDRGKLAGVLVEARWRGERLDWVAIGLGVNVEPPADFPEAARLDPGASRIAVLEALVPELRAAAASHGALSTTELEEYAARDMARSRRCIEPVRGTVRGISSTGELLVELADSTVRIRTGSLVLE
jgi:BirA family biotin operon repressor/biotin-[acetyl-CoA-carboxylase] ligase